MGGWSVGSRWVVVVCVCEEGGGGRGHLYPRDSAYRCSTHARASIPRLASTQPLPAAPCPVQALHLQHLSELRELRALELEGALLTEADLHDLGSLARLSELLIPNAYRLTNGGAAVLSVLTALEALDLGCQAPAPHQALSDAGVAALWGLSRLASLSLAGRSGLTAAGLRFLPGCPGLAALDLSGVRLEGGEAAFLWQLGRLTSLSLAGTAMHALQFRGLHALAALRRLDASRTGFDDACCAELAPLTALSELRLCFVTSRLTAAGLAAVHTCYQLACLRLDGAAVSTCGMSAALAAHPAAVLWPAARDHLPRWFNALHLQLMAVPAPGRYRLRFLHAPEPSACAQARVGAWAVGLMLAHATLLLLLGLVAMVLPLAAAAAATWAGLACAVQRSRAPARCMLARWTRMEALAAGLLAGLYSMEVPLPSMQALDEDY